LAVGVYGGDAESPGAIDNTVAIGEKIPFGAGPKARDLSMSARSQGAAWGEIHDWYYLA
jgi:hypothetical protein